MNVVERVLEMYREGSPDAGAAYGWAYRHAQRLGPEEHVSPLAAPSSRIRVADLPP